MEKKSNLISVIIPAYNEEKYLPKVIKSLRNQKNKNFEIIVIDNNSKDNTYKLAKKIADKVYKCKEQGISPSRNLGAKKSNGEILAFVDADSIASRDWIRIIDKAFRKNEKLTAISGFDSYEHSNIFKRIIINLFSYGVFYFGKISTFLGYPMIIANNLAIKKNTFLSIGGFDKFIVEDKYFNLKLRKLKDRKIKIDRKMKVECSSRRLVSNGIFNTYKMWFLAYIRKMDASNYAMEYK